MSLASSLSCRCNRLLLGTLLFLAFLAAPCAALATTSRQVLVLNSYYPGMAWTNDIMSGIRSVFSTASPAIDLQVEYMDTKRHPSPGYAKLLDQLLAQKLTGGKWDLVIVSDNDAFEFALRHRRQLFAAAPIVFCGVNDFKPSMLDGQKGITGIAEEPSYLQTVELGLRLFPKVKDLVVVGRTQDLTGRLIKDQMMSALAPLRHRLRLLLWDDVPLPILQRRLAALPAASLVLLTSPVVNDQGQVLSYQETARALSSDCPVPVLGLWDFFLGSGVLGGKVVSGLSQGEEAARLALRILHGTSPDQLPVIAHRANTAMFDYRQMQRFRIPLSAVPKGSVIIHKPSRFYQISKKGIWVTFGALLLLTMLSVLLLWNIHARQEAEKALREGEERLRLALAGAQDALWDWDAVTGRNIVDEQWCAMLGYRKEEIAETISQWQTLIHPEDFPAIQAAQKECIAGRQSFFSGEFRMRAKDGSWKWIHGRGKVVARDRTGRALRLTGTHRDISQQKADEQALQKALAETAQAKGKIDAILKSIVHGLLATDLDGRLVLINPAAEQMLGITATQATGTVAESVITEPALRRHLTGALAKRAEEFTTELELYDHKRREVRAIEARTNLIRDQRGESGGLITILLDTTQVREMDRLKSEFIATAAHELRTPLTVIMGYAELLGQKEEFSAEQQQEFATAILDRAEALARIVDDLLDLSRIEAGRLISLNRRPCPLAPLIAQLVDHYQQTSPRHSFEKNLALPGPTATADPAKISQVLENLLSNAVKYSPSGGRIRIFLGDAEGQCLISVSDEGIGMSAEQTQRIFDKFYRADVSDSAIGGLGLGMAIVKAIVEGHGGRIWVESALGQGTKVSFTLPRNVPKTASEGQAPLSTVS